MYFLTFRNKQAAEYQIIRRKYTINEKILRIFGLMDKNVARKLFNPLFYLPLQLFEKMNKKFAFTVVAK